MQTFTIYVHGAPLCTGFSELAAHALAASKRAQGWTGVVVKRD